MFEQNPSGEFLKHLTARDFERLASSLAPTAQARMLLPRGSEEHSGRHAIARRLKGWFEAAHDFDVVATREDMVGSRHRLSWRFHLGRDGRPPEVIEQVAFVDIGAGGIERIDLLCSGFLSRPSAATPAQVFEAGNMGCADGLAQEFRRRIGDVPVGESLAIVVHDPAAKEDLPALARMLGHSVTSIEAQDEGRLAITVERLR